MNVLKKIKIHTFLLVATWFCLNVTSVFGVEGEKDKEFKKTISQYTQQILKAFDNYKDVLSNKASAGTLFNYY